MRRSRAGSPRPRPMPESTGVFVDEVDIHVAAGHGGRGAMAFRREKFVPRGGPSGGDGGPGGSVYLVANANLNTLLNFRFQKIFEAGRGGHGEGSNRTGKNGAGHRARRCRPARPCTSDRATATYSAGRRPHRGRAARADRQGRPRRPRQRRVRHVDQPRAAQVPARDCPARRKIFGSQLKLLADVGLVGFPNAGKSTLIRASRRRGRRSPTIRSRRSCRTSASSGCRGERSFVVADVPGLIEGAHAGHGLGHRFLSHLERTKVLVHLVDVSSSSGRDPVEDFDVITRELELFPGRDASGERLAEKPIVAAANKIDALDDPERLARLQAHLEGAAIPLFTVSAATGEGVDALLEAVWRQVAASRERAASAPPSTPYSE